MNDSKKPNVIQIKERKLRHIDSIIKYVNKYPQGVTFTELRDSERIPDSTLSRSLKFGIAHGHIIRHNGKYFPASGNFALPIFRMAMEVIHDGNKKSEITGKPQYDNEKLNVVLGEVVGIPGHPSSYVYHKLATDTDILDLEKILLTIIKGELKEFNKFTWSLANFIRACVSYAAERSLELRKEIVRILREIEALLFDEEDVLSKIEKREVDKASWYVIYLTLCNLEDNQISLVLDRLIEYAEHIGNDKEKMQKRGKSEEDSSRETDESQDDFQKIIQVIRNELWQDTLIDILYRRNLEFFNKQLKYAAKPDLSGFFRELRRGQN